MVMWRAMYTVLIEVLILTCAKKSLLKSWNFINLETLDFEILILFGYYNLEIFIVILIIWNLEISGNLKDFEIL